MLKKISIVISSPDHPINVWIESWLSLQSTTLQVEIVRNPLKLKGGDLCFLVSCTDIVPKVVLEKYSHVLVIHASDLPEGRGWSPHIWQIINGGKKVVVSLIEASEKVDQGDIWEKYSYKIPAYFLYEDIMKIINQAHLDLMSFAINNCDNVKPKPQKTNVNATYLSRRTPADSEISAFKSIAEQFNTIRVCDKKRFPSFFYLHGKKFKVIVERCHDKKNNY